MKKLSFLFYLLLIIHFKHFRQDVKLPGVVVEQNSKYKSGKINYLPNVEVKSLIAAPQLSDLNGEFNLVFSSKPRRYSRNRKIQTIIKRKFKL